MKIRWRSPWTPFSWGIRCDVCGEEGDPERVNMSYYHVHGHGDWDVCSVDCLHVLDTSRYAPYVADVKKTDYVGGTLGTEAIESGEYKSRNRFMDDDIDLVLMRRLEYEIKEGYKLPDVEREWLKKTVAFSLKEE